MMKTQYDVIVVGGGAAGLSGALTLARARRSVLVIDSGLPRNAPASGMHNYLGREGIAPSEFLAIGREEAASYGAEIVTGVAVTAERLDGGGFRVELEDGTTRTAARLLVTTGLVDELPEVAGLAERWGREVLHCPYCHGYEVRDRRIGVLASGPMAVRQALLWRQWSDRVTLFLNDVPSPTGEDLEQLAARDIAVVGGKVTGLEVTDDALTGVNLADGRVVPVEAVVVAPRFTARAGVLAGLGLEPVDHEMAGHVLGSHIAADPTGATEVPGVWVAGNVANVAEVVIGSVAAGVKAAGAINADLVAEETREAVAARRTHPAEHGGTQVLGGEEFWDARYSESDRVWSGNPNDILVREAADLPPGTALDLGCGEGADAIWLAGRGWRVTAVDVSGVALERAARQAAEAGVADRVDWQRHDLGRSFPEGVYDLVSAHFLHSYAELPRERVLRRAAEAVAPGGVLLIVGHAGFPSWEENPHPDVHFPTPQEVLRSLELRDGAWQVELAEEHERVQTRPDGTPGTRTDNVLRLRRRTG
ncbi:FAD-dependent oxidoreductase [Nonomuraea ceibae]|uniref:FAD-dependent oxidoreductase n=1 Tax=Nonomuraea ceibae TaxID=1935170 RepID=UPI001FE82637|nr:FAD-dependent oxidoreductase [Nonomuraea ceibae]